MSVVCVCMCVSRYVFLCSVRCDLCVDTIYNLIPPPLPPPFFLQGAGLLLMMYGFSLSHRDNMEPDGSGNDVLTVAVKAEADEADEAVGTEVGDSTNANTVDASEMDEASDTSDTGQSGDAGEEIILRVGPKRYTYSAFCSLIDALTRRAAVLRVGDGAEENGGGRTKGRDGGEAGGDIQEGQRTLLEQQSQKEEQGSNGGGAMAVGRSMWR